MGGVFNVVNLHVYHYAGNNPVKYVDPDGRANTLSITPSDVELFLEETKQALSSIPTPAVVCVGIASGLIVANELSDGAVFEGIADGINFIADKTIEAGKWIGEKIGGLFSKGDKEKLKSEDKQEKQSLPDMQNKPSKHPDYKPPKNWNGKKERNQFKRGQQD